MYLYVSLTQNINRQNYLFIWKIKNKIDLIFQQKIMFKSNIVVQVYSCFVWIIITIA